jgi:hypothetical protein
MEVSGQLHDPAALPPGREPPPRWYPLDKRLGGPQSRSGRGGEDMKRGMPKNNILFCYRLTYKNNVLMKIPGPTRW